jgi:hypothetical protein
MPMDNLFASNINSFYEIVFESNNYYFFVMVLRLPLLPAFSSSSMGKATGQACLKD